MGIGGESDNCGDRGRATESGAGNRGEIMRMCEEGRRFMRTYSGDVCVCGDRMEGEKLCFICEGVGESARIGGGIGEGVCGR